LVWLVQHDFPPLHWAGKQLGTENGFKDTYRTIVYQSALLAIPVLAAALTLLPWRTTPAAQWTARPARVLVLVIAAVLVFLPTLVAIPLHVRLKNEWGDALYFIVPIALLALMPWLAVRRRAVARMATVAVVATALQVIVSPFYA